MEKPILKNLDKYIKKCIQIPPSKKLRNHKNKRRLKKSKKRKKMCMDNNLQQIDKKIKLKFKNTHKKKIQIQPKLEQL